MSRTDPALDSARAALARVVGAARGLDEEGIAAAVQRHADEVDGVVRAMERGCLRAQRPEVWPSAVS